MLIEEIGTCAMLEQTAEECNELAKACLKLARHYRGENKVWNKSEDKMLFELTDEIADVTICLEELYGGWPVIDLKSATEKRYEVKRERMKERLAESNKDVKDSTNFTKYEYIVSYYGPDVEHDNDYIIDTNGRLVEELIRLGYSNRKVADILVKCLNGEVGRAKWIAVYPRRAKEENDALGSGELYLGEFSKED